MVDEDDQLHPPLPLGCLVSVKDPRLKNMSHVFFKIKYRGTNKKKDIEKYRESEGCYDPSPFLAVLSYLVRVFREEEAEDHEVGEGQEEVDMCVVLVLLHEETRPEIARSQGC